MVDKSIYLSSISYGMHCLHHLFPTVDQSKLPLLVNMFNETCKEFIILRKPKVTDMKKRKSTNNNATNNDDDIVISSDNTEDINATKMFIENRQITIFGGWYGMLKQVCAVVLIRLD